MTRASLLHILDHVTGISEAEVRELEQLATAFPYCQTAHMLLAKAAHDRGSMLASQRLRRAATYAADRELLRRIIETPVKAEAVAPRMPETEPVAVAEAEAAGTPRMQAEPAAALVAAYSEAPETAQVSTSADELVAADLEPDEVVPDSSAELSAPAEPLETTAEVEIEDTEEPEPIQEPEPLQALSQAAEPELTSATEPQAPAAETNEAATALVSDELPPVAPLIRPPVEVGSSRFEFGLAEAADPLPAYQLPELADNSLLSAASVPSFKADEHLGYAMLGGSRFGAAITLRDKELTHDLPVAEHWHPDAIMQAHLAAHRTAPAPAVSSLALIDRFLRSQPRLKTATPRPPTSEEPQADLSVRSTSPPPSLASESLAKILVRQGKTGRAIEIYEQLMQRQPEKKAYFAAQIDQLKQQPE